MATDGSLASGYVGIGWTNGGVEIVIPSLLILGRSFNEEFTPIGLGIVAGEDTVGRMQHSCKIVARVRDTNPRKLGQFRDFLGRLGSSDI